MDPFNSAPLNCRFAITLVDHYSKWPEVSFILDVTSATVIAFLSTIYGQEAELKTDDGSSLVSAESDDYLTAEGIKHNRSSIFYPCSKREV